MPGFEILHVILIQLCWSVHCARFLGGEAFRSVLGSERAAAAGSGEHYHHLGHQSRARLSDSMNALVGTERKEERRERNSTAAFEFVTSSVKMSGY